MPGSNIIPLILLCNVTAEYAGESELILSPGQPLVLDGGPCRPTCPPPMPTLTKDVELEIDEDEDEYPALPGQVWMEGDSLAPPCQSDLDIVDDICGLGCIDADDVFFDLGCGDGRICIAVAQVTGARARGVEIEERLVKRFRTRIARAEKARSAVDFAEDAASGPHNNDDTPMKMATGKKEAVQQASESFKGTRRDGISEGTRGERLLFDQSQHVEGQERQLKQLQHHLHPQKVLEEGRVKVIWQDLLTVDLFQASVIYLYLLPEGIQALRSQIEAWLDGHGEGVDGNACCTETLKKKRNVCITRGHDNEYARGKNEVSSKDEGEDQTVIAVVSNDWSAEGTTCEDDNAEMLCAPKKRRRRRRLICNTWGLPGRAPAAVRDVGAMANVRLLLYESPLQSEE